MTDNDSTPLDALGAAELARERGLTPADSVALRGLSRADAERVAAAFTEDEGERDPLKLIANVRRY